MTTNGPEISKNVKTLKNDKNCLEVLSNLKCRKNGLEFRNVEKRSEMSKNIEE